ncbi:MAG: hypothetical protein M3342_22750 [Bacteroidota bacterium]|nr:hypothetical protein [Nitrososphaera sp.]MDQ3846805.1 hypothetical protein [Bacteroidota bacterium]
MQYVTRKDELQGSPDKHSGSNPVVGCAVTGVKAAPVVHRRYSATGESRLLPERNTKVALPSRRLLM